jgi:hypothetical protein
MASPGDGLASHPVVEAGLYDAPTGTALVLANFSYRPIEALAVRVPIARPLWSTSAAVEHSGNA